MDQTLFRIEFVFAKLAKLSRMIYLVKEKSSDKGQNHSKGEGDSRSRALELHVAPCLSLRRAEDVGALHSLSVHASPALDVVGTANAERALASAVLVGARVRVAFPLGTVRTGAGLVPVVDQVDLFGSVLAGINEERISAIGGGGLLRVELDSSATRVGENEGDVTSKVVERSTRFDHTAFTFSVGVSASPLEEVAGGNYVVARLEVRMVPDVLARGGSGNSDLSPGDIDFPEGGGGDKMSIDSSSPDIEGLGFLSLEKGFNAVDGDHSISDLRNVEPTNESSRVGTGGKITYVGILGNSGLRTSGVETKLRKCEPMIKNTLNSNRKEKGTHTVTVRAPSVQSVYLTTRITICPCFLEVAPPNLAKVPSPLLKFTTLSPGNNCTAIWPPGAGTSTREVPSKLGSAPKVFTHTSATPSVQDTCSASLLLQSAERQLASYCCSIAVTWLIPHASKSKSWTR